MKRRRKIRDIVIANFSPIFISIIMFLYLKFFVFASNTFVKFFWKLF